MTNDVKVSVVCLAYNHEAYIRECLDSIHANSMTMINWLWKDFLNISAKYNLSFVKLMTFSIITALGIFAVCTLIDIIRAQTIEKIFLNRIETNRYYLKAKKVFEIF